MSGCDENMCEFVCTKLVDGLTTCKSCYEISTSVTVLMYIALLN